MSGSFRMYDKATISNREIIEDTTTGGPALPTIIELNPIINTKARWVWENRRSAIFLPNGEFMIDVRMHRHLHPFLADPSPTASDIYLVTRAASFGPMPFGSLNHWSFYTQGVFYHLSAPELPREASGKTQHSKKSRNASCMLKCEDLSDPSTDDYIRIENRKTRKTLIAFKVGQTDYRRDQILPIAEWVVSQLSEYGLVTANCQHFAIRMVQRTVMRVCDRLVFCGTATMIADWNFGRNHHPNGNVFDRGVVVAPALPVNQTWLQEQLRKVYWLFKIRGYHNDRQVRAYYEQGPDSFRAWHPPGYWREYWRKYGGDSLNAFVWFKDDIKNGRLKDAFLGRYQVFPDGTRKRPLQRMSKRRPIDDIELPQVGNLAQSNPAETVDI